MQNRNYKTRALTEAGISAAIILIIYLASSYIPLFVYLGILLIPTVIGMVYVRHNFKTALGTVATSSILIAITISPIGGLIFPVFMGSMGITLGYCIKSSKEFKLTLLLLAIDILIGGSIVFIIYVALFYNGNVNTMYSQTIKLFDESMKIMTQTYMNIGLPQNKIDIINTNIDRFIKNVKYIMPGAFIVTAGFYAYICYVFSRYILRRFKIEVKQIPQYSKLYITNRVGTFLFGLYIIGVLIGRTTMLNGEYISKTLINSSMVIIQCVLVLDGVALAIYYMKKKFSLSNKIMAIIIIFTVLQIDIIYIYAGLADMILDFRKLDPFKKARVE